MVRFTLAVALFSLAGTATAEPTRFEHVSELFHTAVTRSHNRVHGLMQDFETHGVSAQRELRLTLAGVIRRLALPAFEGDIDENLLELRYLPAPAALLVENRGRYFQRFVLHEDGTVGILSLSTTAAVAEAFEATNRRYLELPEPKPTFDTFFNRPENRTELLAAAATVFPHGIDPATVTFRYEFTPTTRANPFRVHVLRGERDLLVLHAAGSIVAGAAYPGGYPIHGCQPAVTAH